MDKYLPVFFMALGIVLGGTFIGALGSLISGISPLKAMIRFADDLKLYAVICAIGGTFVHLRHLEGVFFQGDLSLILQQFLVLLSAFLGAQLGYWIIMVLAGGL